MKKLSNIRWNYILPALIVLLAAAGIVCRWAGVGSSVRVGALEGVELSVRGVSGQTVSVELSNGTGEELGYGDFYVLQVYSPLWGWVDAPEAELEQALLWHDVEYRLTAGDDLERDYGLWHYEDVSAGKYRIVIPVWTDDPSEKTYVAAEFTV